MQLVHRLVAAVSAFALVFAGTAIPSTAQETLSADVASSVTQPFEEFVKIFESQHKGVKVDAKYLGGQQIQADVEADKPIDVVVVGKNQTDKVTSKISTPVALLTNKEVVLVPKNSTKISSLKDLGNPGVKVALGTAESAVGGLARAVLKKAAADPTYGGDFPAKVRANTVVEAVKGSEVVDAVASGKADAAIAFVSDVDPQKFRGVAIPDNLNVESVYYIFVPKAAKNAALGNDMVKIASSSQGQTILKNHRYLPPPKT
jgi:molybdate transport system substrate-binding protein